MLRVGVTELDIGFENREEAKKRCLEVMEEACANGVELLVFPEMTLTGFTMRPWLHGESGDADNIPDSVSFFMENSKKYKMPMVFGYIRAVMADGSLVYDEMKENAYENRLGLVDNLKDPVKIEMELRKILPPEHSSDFCHCIVLHGRAVCDARKPNCAECCLRHLCQYFSGENK